MRRLPDPARMCPVKAAPLDDFTDDWPICYQTGNSGAELRGIATDNVRGSVLASQDFPADAREDAEARQERRDYDGSGLRQITCQERLKAVKNMIQRVGPTVGYDDAI